MKIDQIRIASGSERGLTRSNRNQGEIDRVSTLKTPLHQTRMSGLCGEVSGQTLGPRWIQSQPVRSMLVFEFMDSLTAMQRQESFEFWP